MPAIEIRGKGKRLFPRSSVGTINNRPQKSPAAKRNAGPAKRTVRGMTGLRGRKQPFGAEPGGGVRNREQGANCLSAASFCPAGSAARRPGSSQRQGCPFFWFFSLGRQRKERLPARGAAGLVTLERPGGRSHAGAWERSRSCCWPVFRTCRGACQMHDRGHGPLLLPYRAGGEGWEGAMPARDCGANKEARPADTRWPGPLYAYAAQMPKPGSRS